MKNRLFRSITVALIALPLLGPIAAEAKREIITVTSRYDNAEGGQNITLPCLLDTPAGGEITAVLLVIPRGNGRINLRTKDGRILHDVNNDPFIRNTALFHERSLGLAMPDVPSDRDKGFGIAYRKTREHAADIAAVLQDLRERFPKARVYLAASGGGGVSALFAADTLGRDLNGIVLAGIDSSQVHAYDHSGVKVPVLLLHHRADGCDGSPFIEAKEIADRYGFAFVPFSGGPPDKESNPCLSRTRHGLFGLDREMVAAIAGWTAGKLPAPPAPGNEPLFLNERVVWVPLNVMGGEVRLQTTLYRPDGPGPFPLAIISHGVPYEKSLEAEIRFRQRFCLQSGEFVKRGFAVAVPMRRGYGSSTGMKNKTIVNIADFGLQDARDIQAAIDHLGREPFIDARRIVLVGQSGGGLASLAAGSLGNPHVKGIINFAGGLRRTSVAMWEQDMAQAFGIYAKTTRAPSLWFYTANDSYFSPATVSQTYETYRQNGGQARLVALPAFKRDGHGLFADFEGRALWVKEMEQFLTQIGFTAPAGSGGASQP